MTLTLRERDVRGMLCFVRGIVSVLELDLGFGVLMVGGFVRECC